MTTRLDRLQRMRDKYLDLGQDRAAARVEARIDEILGDGCPDCHSKPCRCDIDYEKGMDREMFPDE